jgi:hypothetical protein
LGGPGEYLLISFMVTMDKPLTSQSLRLPIWKLGIAFIQLLGIKCDILHKVIWISTFQKDLLVIIITIIIVWSISLRFCEHRLYQGHLCTLLCPRSHPTQGTVWGTYWTNSKIVLIPTMDLWSSCLTTVILPLKLWLP